MSHVLILGGGFGGLSVLSELSRLRLTRKHQVTVINRESYHLYTPRLYQVFADRPKPITLDLATTISERGGTFVQGAIAAIDLKNRSVRLSDQAAPLITYDYLVVALGSQCDFFGIPGMRAHAWRFKSLEDATELKDHIDQEMLLAAKSVRDGKRAALRVVVIGGGLTGVELSVEIMRYFRRHLPSLGLERYGEVHLVEADQRILPMFSPLVSKRATAYLKHYGVQMSLGRMVKEEHTHKLLLSRQGLLLSETVIWTGGVCADHTASLLSDLPHDHAGRLAVQSTLVVSPGSSVFVIGDAAQSGEPQTAQAAIRQGILVARNIKALINDRPLADYVGKQDFSLLPLGKQGLLIRGSLVVSGRLPVWMRAVADWRYLRQFR